MKLPIKTRILEYALDQNEPFTIEDVASVLKDEYKGERTSSVKNIEKIINTYCGVGVLRAAYVELKNSKDLFIKYEITDFGRTYEKMIPGH